jgi:hypothetical protein
VLAALQANLGPVGDPLIANPIGVAGLENPEESPVGVALLVLLV